MGDGRRVEDTNNKRRSCKRDFEASLSLQIESEVSVKRNVAPIICDGKHVASRIKPDLFGRGNLANDKKNSVCAVSR